MNARARAVGRAQVVATAVLFSTGGAAIKATALGGLEVAALRSAFAAIALGIFLAFGARHRRRDTVMPVRAVKARLEGGALGVVLSYAATMTLFVMATKWTTAANAIFLQASAPLFVAPLAYFALGEHVERADACLDDGARGRCRVLLRRHARPGRDGAGAAARQCRGHGAVLLYGR